MGFGKLPCFQPARNLISHCNCRVKQVSTGPVAISCRLTGIMQSPPQFTVHLQSPPPPRTTLVLGKLQILFENFMLQYFKTLKMRHHYKYFFLSSQLIYYSDLRNNLRDHLWIQLLIFHESKRINKLLFPLKSSEKQWFTEDFRGDRSY